MYWSQRPIISQILNFQHVPTIYSWLNLLGSAGLLLQVTKTQIWSTVRRKPSLKTIDFDEKVITVSETFMNNSVCSKLILDNSYRKHTILLLLCWSSQYKTISVISNYSILLTKWVKQISLYLDPKLVQAILEINLILYKRYRVFNEKWHGYKFDRTIIIIFSSKIYVITAGLNGALLQSSHGQS